MRIRLSVVALTVVLTGTTGAGRHAFLAALGSESQGTLQRPTSTLVAQGDHVDPQGSVSPDGRYLSFTNWETGDLMLHDLTTGDNRTIVAANNVTPGDLRTYAEGSAISRDGLQVAYGWYDRSTARSELWVASIRGNAQPRRVYGAENTRWLVPSNWSADGRWIAALLSSQDFSYHVAVIAVSDGTMRILKTERGTSGTRPFFSPDGRYLAYDLPQDVVGARDVFVTSVDATKDVRIVAHRENDEAMGWSPDGRYLLVTSDRTGSRALFCLEIRDGTAQGSPVVLKADMGSTVPIGMTDAGALFWSTRSGRQGGSIQVAHFDWTTGRLTSSRDVSARAQENNVNPVWSPDGRYLAYVSLRGDRLGGTPVIVLRAADTGAIVRELAPKLENAVLAGWGPAKGLLVVGRDSSGRNGSFGVDADTGVATFLFATPQAPGTSLPEWSADGQTLYYWNRAGAAGEQVIVARTLASGVERELVRRPLLNGLRLSPNGRHLATSTVDPKSKERTVLIAPTDGAASPHLISIPSAAAPASWAPDGQSLLGRMGREGENPTEMWRIPIDGGAPRKLSGTVPPHVFAFAVSPDGSQVAYRIKESDPVLPTQVWKLEHFLPATAR